jgi:chemotaxis protein CheD
VAVGRPSVISEPALGTLWGQGGIVTERPEVTIHIGQVYATAEPTVIKTILGSCIAVCLLDPAAHVGGMNHFMLPAPGGGGEHRVDRSQFGIHAMDLLIGAIQKAGGERRRLQAKLFGGAQVLRLGGNGRSVPEQNIEFIETFMRTERIVVASRDLGGYLPRRIHFHIESGKVFVKRLGQQVLRETRTEEREALRILSQEAPRFGEITLFDGKDER